MVDGLVLMDVEMRDARVPLLRELDRPSVLIGFPADAGGLTCVDLDFRRAGAACVEHLAALGHREIALLGPPRAVYERDTGFAHRTTAGFRDAAEAVVCEAPSSPARRVSRGAAPADRAVRRRPGLTGLVVHNEAAVAHVLAVARALGRRVPDDVSVVAICPDEIAERSTPPLDSVLIPADEVGARAVELLMRKIDGAGAPDATLLSPRLTARASAVPARTAVGSI